jgi:hypothetical protein
VCDNDLTQDFTSIRGRFLAARAWGINPLKQAIRRLWSNRILQDIDFIIIFVLSAVQRSYQLAN